MPSARLHELPRPRSFAARAALAVTLLLGLGCATLQAQQFARITAAGQQEITQNPLIKPQGAAHPDVLIVEYFDYNCPYCKKLAPQLTALMHRDPRVALLYKDWPILGPVSVYAARAALAAQWQGRYAEAHDALLAAPRLAHEEQVDALLRQAGIDLAALKRDLAAHAEQISAALARDEREANLLELQGTPGLLVGRQLAFGALDAAALDAMIAAARRPGG